MNHFQKIAEAIEILSYAFREAGLDAPEIVVSHDARAHIRSMADPVLLQIDPTSRDDKICGVVIRAQGMGRA